MRVKADRDFHSRSQPAVPEEQSTVQEGLSLNSGLFGAAS